MTTKRVEEGLGKPINLPIFVDQVHKEIVSECMLETTTADQLEECVKKRTTINVQPQPFWLQNAYEGCVERCLQSGNFTECLKKCFDEKTYWINEK